MQYKTICNTSIERELLASRYSYRHKCKQTLSTLELWDKISAKIEANQKYSKI